MMARISACSLVLGILLTGLLLPSAALACSVPAGYDPQCPAGESFNTISCKCAAVQESRETPALRQRSAEEQALADEVRRKAENRFHPTATVPQGPLPAAMVSCASDQDCQVISSVCGNPIAVNRDSASAAAQMITDINKRAECARKREAAPPATTICLSVQQYCVLVLPPVGQP